MTFKSKIWPYIFVLPQIAITCIFFVLPAGEAVYESFLQQDLFGFQSLFVGLDNYIKIFSDPQYLKSIQLTFLFSFSVAFLSMSIGLLIASQVYHLVRSLKFYRWVFVWPYAVAPAIAGVLWMFMFNPSLGVVSYFMQFFGYDWNYVLHAPQAMFLVVIAASWKQISYNFIFFLAGLMAVPKSIIEAAALDGAGPLKRFWRVIFPMISPTTFFLFVMNIIYAYFETFGVIHTVTSGGPARATETLVYKAWHDGFQANQFGTSSAQSVVLMFMVLCLTIIQFKYVEKKVHYK